jgi:WD40 repeat protein
MLRICIIVNSLTGVFGQVRQDLDWKLLVLDAHTDWISRVAWAPDGSKFVTVAHDHSIKIWAGS